MSASDREWNGADYLAVQKAIQKNPSLLPLMRQRRWNTFLFRLTNTENFSFNRNKDLPIGNRLNDYIQIQESTNAILKIYVNLASQGSDLHAETAAILSFTLRVGALGIDLVNEFLPTIPKDDTYEVRMQGLKKMNEGLATCFAGAEISLNETTFYLDGEIAQILQAMHDTLPTFKTVFTPEYTQELAQKLERHRKTFKGENLKRIEEMIVMLTETWMGPPFPCSGSTHRLDRFPNDLADIIALRLF